MKNSQKDSLLSKFQNSRIDRTRLDKINGGKLVTSPGQDLQTGVTSGGNHDNNVTAPDKYYDGTL